MFKDLKISVKLLVIVVSSAIFTVSATSYVGIRTVKEVTINNQITMLEHIADLKVQKIDLFFHERRADIMVTQGYFNIKTNLPIVTQFADDRNNHVYLAAKKMLDDQIRIFQDANECYVDFMLVDSEGNVVYSFNEVHEEINFDNPITGLEGQKAFEQEKKDVYFSDIYISRFKDYVYGMLITAPVYGFNEQFIGVIVLVLNLDPIYEFIQDTIGLGETGETLIGKKIENGALFINPLRHDKFAALKRKAILGKKSAFPILEAVQGRNGSGFAIDYRDKEIMAAWRYIPTLDWGLVAKIDVSEAFAPIKRLEKIVFYIAVFIIVNSLAGAFLLSIYITRPVKKLSDTILKVSKGDLKQRVYIKSRDEIGLLADSFNMMTNELMVSMVSRDEMLKHQIEIEKLNHNLANINRELEAFCYSVSHDLRAPLRSINGFSDALLEDYNDKLDAQGKDYLNRVCAATRRMGLLIDDLLALSRITRSEINCEMVNLSELAQVITENLREKEPERQAEVIIAEKVFVNCDKRLLWIALQNLFDNAWKFTNRKAKARIEFGISLSGKKISYFVKDDGAGFDMTYVDKLFTPFQRLHTLKEFEGTGIGLTTVKRIINKHGGDIRAQGEVGKGTTIYFTL